VSYIIFVCCLFLSFYCFVFVAVILIVSCVFGFFSLFISFLLMSFAALFAFIARVLSSM